MRINFTIDATVKEMNTMKNPTELELPEALLGKIVAAVWESYQILSTGQQKSESERSDFIV